MLLIATAVAVGWLVVVVGNAVSVLVGSGMAVNWSSVGVAVVVAVADGCRVGVLRMGVDTGVFDMKTTAVGAGVFAGSLEPHPPTTIKHNNPKLVTLKNPDKSTVAHYLL